MFRKSETCYFALRSRGFRGCGACFVFCAYRYIQFGNRLKQPGCGGCVCFNEARVLDTQHAA